MKSLLTLSVLCLSLSLIHCKAKDADSVSGSVDSEEVSQQVGDTMASLDEAGGSTGQLSLMQYESRTFARLVPDFQKNPKLSIILPQAEAAACSTGTFSGCASNVITRTFGGCTVGSATFSGTVTSTFVDAGVDTTCLMASNGHTVTRVPNYTVTGLRGATLTVSKSSTVGQKITRTGAGQYQFDNDGIRRKFEYNGQTLFDYTTTVPTSDPLILTGATRSGRVISSGKITVTNNVSGATCSLTPSAVTWNGTCNCAVSGSWTGTCGDSTAKVEITGCGTSTVTVGTTSRSVTFDRCY